MTKLVIRGQASKDADSLHDCTTTWRELDVAFQVVLEKDKEMKS
jgi:hypothetical protein